MKEIARDSFLKTFRDDPAHFLLANSKDIELLKIAGLLRKLRRPNSLPHMSHVMLNEYRNKSSIILLQTKTTQNTAL